MLLNINTNRTFHIRLPKDRMLTELILLIYRNVCQKLFHQIVYNFIDCPVGYYGDNCSFSCPVPTDGNGCAETCSCSNASCHHVYGCNLTTGLFKFTTCILFQI